MRCKLHSQYVKGNVNDEDQNESICGKDKIKIGLDTPRK